MYEDKVILTISILITGVAEAIKKSVKCHLFYFWEGQQTCK